MNFRIGCSARQPVGIKVAAAAEVLRKQLAEKWLEMYAIDGLEDLERRWIQSLEEPGSVAFRDETGGDYQQPGQ